jgi:hypothetical protein
MDASVGLQVESVEPAIKAGTDHAHRFFAAGPGQYWILRTASDMHI